MTRYCYWLWLNIPNSGSVMSVYAVRACSNP